VAQPAGQLREPLLQRNVHIGICNTRMHRRLCSVHNVPRLLCSARKLYNMPAPPGSR
jgi:hypothetical protein